MQKFHFKNILENSGWRQNVLIETDDTGTITSISESNLVDKDVNLIEGFVLPGFACWAISSIS